LRDTVKLALDSAQHGAPQKTCKYNTGFSSRRKAIT